jgi:hypothetical protein
MNLPGNLKMVVDEPPKEILEEDITSATYLISLSFHRGCLFDHQYYVCNPNLQVLLKT